MNQPRRRFITVLEDILGEDTSGKEMKEVEHVFYGKILDANALAELAKQPYVTKILQEQFQVKLDLGKNEGLLRTIIRARRVNGGEVALTRKTYIKGETGPKESTIEVGAEVFDFLRSAAGEGLYKMRYTIQPEGWDRKLELDVFLDAAYHPTGYAKYDYEVPEDGKDLPLPPLPVALKELRHLNPFTATAEDAEQLRSFMASMSVPA